MRGCYQGWFRGDSSGISTRSWVVKGVCVGVSAYLPTGLLMKVHFVHCHANPTAAAAAGMGAAAGGTAAGAA